jgi:hypothetical protein
LAQCSCCQTLAFIAASRYHGALCGTPSKIAFINFRNSNTGEYVFNVLWIRLGRQPSYKRSQEKCKIEKVLLVNSIFYANWEKVSLLNISIETALFSSWNTCSVRASLAATAVDDYCVRFEVLVALGAKNMVFLDMLPLSLVAQDEACNETNLMHYLSSVY